MASLRLKWERPNKFIKKPFHQLYYCTNCERMTAAKQTPETQEAYYLFKEPVPSMSGLNAGYLLTLECYACNEMGEFYFEFYEKNVDRQKYFDEWRIRV